VSGSHARKPPPPSPHPGSCGGTAAPPPPPGGGDAAVAEKLEEEEGSNSAASSPHSSCSPLHSEVRYLHRSQERRPQFRIRIHSLFQDTVPALQYFDDDIFFNIYA
jgi:hypothetical protein